MANLFFITDLHITTTCSSRVDDPLEAVIGKLQWVVDYCNLHCATLVMGGDIFDTPTVTFEAYNALVSVLRSVHRGVYVVWGNHDMLYRNTDNNRKCTLYTLIESGVVKELRQGMDVVLDSELILTSNLPLRTRQIPQVLVYHGFLEQRDGSFTVTMSDLMGCESGGTSLVLLGHDHTKYDDVVLPNGVTVVRCGSFFRNRRDESCRRQVYGVMVECSNGVIHHTLVEVPARTPDEVFASKSSQQVADAQMEEVSYDALISSLRSSTGSQDLTFSEALGAVAEQDVVSYCETLVSNKIVKKVK